MTGYCDLHKGNFVRSATTNQLVIIDTEDNAFVRNKEEISCFYGEDPKNIFDFFRQEIIVLMDIKAFKWFRQYCQECSVEEVFYNFKPIPINQDYDHLIGVDFEQVKTALPAHMRMKSKL